MNFKVLFQIFEASMYSCRIVENGWLKIDDNVFQSDLLIALINDNDVFLVSMYSQARGL